MEITKDSNGKVLEMIKKPNLKEAKKYKTGDEFLSISGIVVLNSKIFEFIEKTKPGKNGEIQLTDSIEMMRKNHPVHAHVFRGKKFDIGAFGVWKGLRKSQFFIYEF